MVVWAEKKKHQYTNNSSLKGGYHECVTNIKYAILA